MADRPFRLLTLGFSVTAEAEGYIKFAQERSDGDGIEYRKVGLGGFAPKSIPPLLDYILTWERPDALVLEIATSAFRQVPGAQEVHRGVLASMLNQIHERGIPCAMYDLPRADVDHGTDWMVRMHKDVCEELGLAYRRVDPEEGMFRDMVHPTESGREVMGLRYMELVETLKRDGWNVPGAVAAEARDFCFPVRKLINSPEGEMFHRAGLHMQTAELRPGKPQRLRLPKPARVTGLMVVAGPKSGTLRLTSEEGEERLAETYDIFCYYQRPFHVEVDPFVTRSLMIEQLPDLPEVTLQKGDKDTGPRLGQLLALFCTEDIAADAQAGMRLKV